MARPLLPPRRYSIPTHMIFKSQLPPAVFLTWLQLRSLTWCGQDIPPFSSQDWFDLTGTSRTTFFRHLNLLQAKNALRWHSPQPGVICVSFAAAPFPIHGIQESVKEDNSQVGCPKMDSPKMGCSKMGCSKMGNPPSLNPLTSNNPVKIPLLKPENQASDQISVDLVEREGEGECEGERGHKNLPTPASVYRSLVHLTPNRVQRRLLETKIANLPLWQHTVEHWVSHGWNPRNLTGMLELYDRGGPSGCHFCHTTPGSVRQAKTPQEYTHDAIEDLRSELGLPSPPEAS
jgi:hypothetical protein